MLWDTHMHSQYSGDSDAPQEDMIRAAIRAKLPGICFTDHLDIDYPDNPEAFLSDRAELHVIRFRHAGTVPGSDQRALRHRAGAPAASWQRCMPIFSRSMTSTLSSVPPMWYTAMIRIFRHSGRRTPRRKDTANTLSPSWKNIRAFDDFDVYGHIDYVVRYGPTRNENYTYARYSDVIDEILRLLIEKGKGIEINTGGFKYGLGHPNPCEEILARYRELGGEIITVGADAHAPEHVGFAFEKVPQILKDAGFTYYTVFRKRKPEFIKIED